MIKPFYSIPRLQYFFQHSPIWKANSMNDMSGEYYSHAYKLH